MRLPTTWRKAETGHYLHLETGIEIHRAGSAWQVRIPGRPGRHSHGTHPTGLPFPTLTAALASSTVRDLIPRIQHIIATARANACLLAVGQPSTWTTTGPADPETVDARRAAVTAAGLTTGAHAKPGQVIVHIQTGTLGIVLGGGGGYATVNMTDFPVPHSVEEDDVVVIDWFGCLRLDDGHREHVQALGLDCLTDDPDEQLDDPEMTPVRGGGYIASDDVEIVRETDGTWSAWAPSYDRTPPASMVKLCSHQTSLARTYRWINRWRRRHTEIVEAARTAASIAARSVARRLEPGTLFFAHDIDGWELVGDGQCFAYSASDIIGAQMWAAKLLCPSAPATVTWTARYDARGTWYRPQVPGPESRVTETPGPDAGGPPPRLVIRYLIETRVPGDRWDSEHGETPPLFGDSPESLQELAETILVNIVGSRTRDPWRPIRVTTWHPGTPHTGHARRDPVRYSHR